MQTCPALFFSLFVLKRSKKQRKFKAKPEPSGHLCRAIASPSVASHLFYKFVAGYFFLKSAMAFWLAYMRSVLMLAAANLDFL